MKFKTKMDQEGIRKLTYFVNTVILIMVFGLMFFFWLCKADFMVWFSIPTAVVYLVGYVLIRVRRLREYVLMVYLWLTLYMMAATVCLGYEYGFHLYSLSMLPIIYYTEYMSHRMNQKKMVTAFFTVLIVLGYLVSTIYVALFGPLYERHQIYAAVFWAINSVTVFCFLIFYTKVMIGNIIRSEQKLTQMSMTDRLTGLYNRHYMMEQLATALGASQKSVAILDIDDFKKINDRYGHNAGDEVLSKVAEIMRSECSDMIVSRWGGEEFLILMDGTKQPREAMERLRSAIKECSFEYDGRVIPVTVTIGLASRKEGMNVDEWVGAADGKLYEGKNSGKDRVVE